MTPKSLSLQHLIQPPKQYSAKPKALFMFHGYGSNEEDLFSFAPELPLIEGFAENDFSKLNIYTSHGQVDQVIPLEWAQKTPAFLDALRIANTYEEFPVGHGVAPQNFYSFRNWLENR